MSPLEHKIADFYAEKLLSGVKSGDTTIAVWFPGMGKRTIISNIVLAKDILVKYLGKLVKRLAVVHLRCDLVSPLTADGLISEFKDLLKLDLEKVIENDNEILLFVTSPDLFC